MKQKTTYKYQRIRDTREDNDYTQKEIADILNLYLNQYRRYETGETTIPINIVKRLSKLYKVSIDYLTEIEEEIKWLKGKKKKTVQYAIYLILTGKLLFIIGNLLSNTLENLSFIFNIPEFVIGIALGFITSIPELITFFESQKHHKKKDNHTEGVIEATNNLLISNMMNLFVIQTIAIVLYSVLK